jgi:hypothetical protein
MELERRFPWSGLLAAGLAVGWLVGLSGCAAPGAVRDASTKQVTNLAALQQARAQLTDQLDAWLNHLIEEQRDAFVAMQLSDEIDRLAQSLDTPRPGDTASRDLIAAGVALADARHHAVTQWNFWLRELDGETLEDRQHSLTTRVGQLQDLARQLEPAAQASPDGPEAKRLVLVRRALELSQPLLAEGMPKALRVHASTALALEKQRKTLHGNLDVLGAQLSVMQAIHGVVDKYLQIDATIDGQAIGEAMAAGAAVDTSKLSGLKTILPGGGQ